jgi:hypothetical protein
MTEMRNLYSNDINHNFIIINKEKRKINIISEYIGIGGYGENNHLTHKFRLSYTLKFNIFYDYYPIGSQKNYIIYRIDLPFDIITNINQFLYTY